MSISIKKQKFFRLFLKVYIFYFLYMDNLFEDECNNYSD